MTTSRKAPAVAFTDLAQALAAAPRGSAVLGVDEHNNPVAYDPHRTPPNLAITAPTGAGRSAMLRLVIAQALAHGTRVTLGDRKGSQRWCHDHPAVTVARDAAGLHHALCALAAEHDDHDPGQPRPLTLVALDDQNTLMGQLVQHWRTTADDDADPISPAVTSFAELLYSGRGRGITVASAAVLFSAQTLGGHNLRDGLMAQYGTRLAGPGTSPIALELLGDDAEASPAPSRHDRGAFDVMTASTRTRIQAVWITETEARSWANTSH